MGADMGGVAVPFDGARRSKQSGDFRDLVVVPDRQPVDPGLGDDVVIDLRTGEPVLELQAPVVAPANRLVTASAIQRGFKRTLDIVLATTAIILLAPVFIAAASRRPVRATSP